MRFAWWSVCFIFLCTFLAAFFGQMEPSYVFVTGILVLLTLFLIVFGENIKTFSLGFGDAKLQLEKVVRQASAVSNRLERALAESEKYWNKISRKHKTDSAELMGSKEMLVEPNVNATIDELLVDLEEQLKNYDIVSDKMAETLNNRWEDTLKFFQEYDFDINNIKKIPYYENPLHDTKTYDMTHMAIPNLQLRSHQLFYQSIIKVFEELEKLRELSHNEQALKEKAKNAFEDQTQQCLVD